MSRLGVQIRINDHGAADALRAMPELLKIAQGRALTRTADWARVRTVRAIAGHIALAQSDLNGSHRFGGVTATKANPDKLHAEVNITGARIPLFRFAGRPTEPVTPKGRAGVGGVSYQIDAQGGRKRITENAFMLRAPSGHRGFFRRIGGGRRIKMTAKGGKRAGKSIWSEKGLAELFGPSIPHVAEESPEFRKLLEVDCGARLELEMERQVTYIITGSSAGDGEDE
jgi:hypothetical protein